VSSESSGCRDFTAKRFQEESDRDDLRSTILAADRWYAGEPAALVRRTDEGAEEAALRVSRL
jgi:hypothetical protein